MKIFLYKTYEKDQPLNTQNPLRNKKKKALPYLQFRPTFNQPSITWPKMIISQFARTFCQFVSSRLSARASTCLPAMIAATLMLQCCIREQSRAHRPFCSPKLSKLTFQLKIVWKVSAAKWSETLRSTFFQKFLPETALLSLFSADNFWCYF